MQRSANFPFFTFMPIFSKTLQSTNAKMRLHFDENTLDKSICILHNGIMLLHTKALKRFKVKAIKYNCANRGVFCNGR